MTGEEYSAARKTLGLTQQQLAHLVGVAVSTIQGREQQPDKDVSTEAEIAISTIRVSRAGEVEVAGAG